MTEAELKHFRQGLVRMREELQEIDQTLEASGETVELDQTRVGRLSRMDALQGQQMALEVTRRQKQKLLDIASTLRRMDEGEYGYCLECGEEIDKRRLEVDPTHTHCIDCAE